MSETPSSHAARAGAIIQEAHRIEQQERQAVAEVASEWYRQLSPLLPQTDLGASYGLGHRYGPLEKRRTTVGRIFDIEDQPIEAAGAEIPAGHTTTLSFTAHQVPELGSGRFQAVVVTPEDLKRYRNDGRLRLPAENRLSPPSIIFERVTRDPNNRERKVATPITPDQFNAAMRFASDKQKERAQQHVSNIGSPANAQTAGALLGKR